MKFVADLLDTKGSDVWSVAPISTVYEALEIMANKDVGALVVIDGDKLVGVFSERDYARGLALQGKRSRETPVSEIMTQAIVTVTCSHSVKHCMEVMTNYRVRHLPVLEDEKLVGVVSIGDVVFSIMSDQDTMIHQLETYIEGKL
jgi:CBS domain-containing protein|tara:strand:+ start:165 stop:599 length:435 start_codon:yes stop_codon:yes gene_type:complete